MSCRRCHSTKAFGVEEGFAPYRLRQARYYELGQDCAAWAAEHVGETGRALDLLDVGVGDGVSRRYTEIHPGGNAIRWHGVDIFPRGQELVYKHEDWTLRHVDLAQGLPDLEAARYDIVICEQVLEHLHQPERAIADMYRVLRPGGRLILGVPIFPPGLDLVRKHVVPVTDRLFKVKKVRGHVQGWSRGSFLRLIRRTCPDVKIDQTRGFRIVSGGLLSPLEHYRWWWRLNRRLGRVLAAYCIEVQVVARKPPAPCDSVAPHARAA